jgi:hypothetical protein
MSFGGRALDANRERRVWSDGGWHGAGLIW